VSYVQEVEQKADLQSAVNITTLAADDAVHLVAQAIVTDADAFFKLGAAQNLEELTFPEFMQACESIVPGFSQGTAQNMFTRFDTNKHGKVSLEELIETIELTRHFHKQSHCESVILAALMPLIAGAQPLQALAELSEGLLRDAVVDKVIKALVKQANEVRQTLARKKDFETRENEKGLAKFGTATYGGVCDYFKGLEAVGTPHPHILEHMRKETTESKDSADIFEAWISDSNETFPAREWDFAVEPFKPESIRTDKHPNEWEPKHAYGGKRLPIRLQVFLHVLSAMQMASGIRFGDYKNAHERAFEDPQWLHAAEVSFVKVVLLRLVKSQLGGVALLNAFNKHSGLRLTGKSRCKRAIILARGIVEALRQALHEKDGSESSCTYEFLVDKLKVLSSQLTSQVFPACDLLSKRKHVQNAHSNPCQSLLLTISLGHRD
jgi:Ca2+-binding EF-hand superfamily protein